MPVVWSVGQSVGWVEPADRQHVAYAYSHVYTMIAPVALSEEEQRLVQQQGEQAADLCYLVETTVDVRGFISFLYYVT